MGIRTFKHIKHIFFTGIGGIGMSGLAEIMLESGYEVSGSDRVLSETTDYLAAKGAAIYEGHRADNLQNVDAMVYSSAIPADNPELKRAAELGIPVIRRAEMLAEVMRLNYGIAIAGTHGKTTTTSMCAEILIAAELDPTVVVGGRLFSLKTNARLGKGEFFIAEADEYDRSFLALAPVFAIITSIEADHLDIYRDLDDIKANFVTFANKVPFYGSLIVCSDDPVIRDILPNLKPRVITYGLEGSPDFTARNLYFTELYSRFELYQKNNSLGTFEILIPGEHNVKNAIAAATVALELDIPIEKIKTGLQHFAGIERRFEIKGEYRDVLIADDYAHHPTEIKATLQAARKGYDRRLIAVFQPHLYSRTRDFCQDFARELALADVAIVTEIYPAREEPIPGISGKIVFNALKKYKSNNIHYIDQIDKLPDFILDIAQPGDLVLTIGAGNIYRVGNELISRLKN